MTELSLRTLDNIVIDCAINNEKHQQKICYRPKPSAKKLLSDIKYRKIRKEETSAANVFLKYPKHLFKDLGLDFSSIEKNPHYKEVLDQLNNISNPKKEEDKNLIYLLGLYERDNYHYLLKHDIVTAIIAGLAGLKLQELTNKSINLKAIIQGSLMHSAGHKISPKKMITMDYEKLGYKVRSGAEKIRNLHVLVGAVIAKELGATDEAIDIVYSHHEKNGYPEKLDHKVSDETKVFVYADRFIALIEKRRYRELREYKNYNAITALKHLELLSIQNLKERSEAYKKLDKSRYPGLEDLYKREGDILKLYDLLIFKAFKNVVDRIITEYK